MTANKQFLRIPCCILTFLNFFFFSKKFFQENYQSVKWFAFGVKKNIRMIDVPSADPNQSGNLHCLLIVSDFKKKMSVNCDFLLSIKEPSLLSINKICFG